MAPANVAGQVVMAVLVLATLGVGVAILVTVLNMQNKPVPTPRPLLPSRAPNATTRSRPTLPTRKPTTTTTATAKPAPPIPDTAGIPAAPVISYKDPRFAAFKQVDDTLQAWMDPTVSPCDDFYHYVCGKGQKAKLPSPFAISDATDIRLQMPVYKDDAYFATAPDALKRLKHYFDKCVNNDAKSAEIAAALKQKVEAIKTHADVGFPLLYQSESVPSLSAAQLGKLIGYALSDVGAPSLLSVFVAQDYSNPDVEPARVFIDQGVNLIPDSAWDTQRDDSIVEIVDNVKKIASLLGLPIIDEAKLTADATNIAELDHALARFVTDPITRRQFQRSNNVMKLSDVQTAAPAYDWVELVKAALARANADDKISGNLEVINMEPININGLSAAITANTGNKFDPATIANYIQFRSTLFAYQALPQPTDSAASPIMRKLNVQAAPRFGQGIRKRVPSDHPEMLEQLADTDFSPTELQCFDTVRDTLVEAGDRIFADAAYKTDKEKSDLRSQVTDMANWIVYGFRTQVDILNWMSTKSKEAAFAKMDNIQLNIAFPEWVQDNAKLEEFYQDLTFPLNANTITVYTAINEYKLNKGVENFRLEAPRDRTSFVQAVGQTNAFYNPPANAIIYPGGILHYPLYTVGNPTAVNFGALGTVSGHELTHGFDDKGVQYDKDGALISWMDAQSQQGFNAMADCIINEYDQFCPLPKGQPCVNGGNTQGENIADNGGLQAAYKAFKSYEALNGPDPRLPSKFGQIFNNDQLFFLSFANVWCKREETADEYLYDIENDVHSSHIYRVIGTLKNTPAFRTAFNCPVGSVYAPKDHCDIWTSLPFKPTA